jgi:uncharacterized protein YqeY
MSSTLLDRLLEDIKAAMKARETEALSVLRSTHAQIKDAGTNAGKEITDELVASVITKGITQRKDALAQFREGGREDLVEIEEREIEYLKKYQPEQLDDAAIEALAREAIATAGAESKADVGKVMKELMPKVKGKADGQAVNRIVLGLLG